MQKFPTHHMMGVLWPWLVISNGKFPQADWLGGGGHNMGVSFTFRALHKFTVISRSPALSTGFPLKCIVHTPWSGWKNPCCADFDLQSPTSSSETKHYVSELRLGIRLQPSNNTSLSHCRSCSRDRRGTWADQPFGMQLQGPVHWDWTHRHGAFLQQHPQ